MHYTALTHSDDWTVETLRPTGHIVGRTAAEGQHKTLESFGPTVTASLRASIATGRCKSGGVRMSKNSEPTCVQTKHIDAFIRKNLQLWEYVLCRMANANRPNESYNILAHRLNAQISIVLIRVDNVRLRVLLNSDM
jgi:hypothetical protein